MRFLLDTNICIYIAKKAPRSVAERLLLTEVGDVGMSVITYCELVFGAMKSRRPTQNLRTIEELRQRIPVQAYSADAAMVYGRLRARLERQGTPVGPYDMLIAAHTMSLGFTLVTNNTREFSRIQGLSLENWIDPTDSAIMV